MEASAHNEVEHVEARRPAAAASHTGVHCRKLACREGTAHGAAALTRMHDGRDSVLKRAGGQCGALNGGVASMCPNGSGSANCALLHLQRQQHRTARRPRVTKCNSGNK
jgi:hypothetical protein